MLVTVPTSVVTALDEVVGTGEDVVYELEQLGIVGPELHSRVDAVVYSV